MKQIPLTQGKFALVDDQDYEFLMQWKWCANKNHKTFYGVRGFWNCLKQITVQMHRVIAKRMGLDIKDKKVDHIDRNGLNNCRGNLRIATNSQSQANRNKRKNNISGYIGVSEHKCRNNWHARIQVNGNDISLGYFTNKKDAAKAYNKAALKYFGEFARLNNYDN
jgi:hypothetical protein